MPIDKRIFQVVGGVAVLAAIVFLSKAPTTTPDGTKIVTSVDEKIDTAKRAQELSVEAIKKNLRGEALTEKDKANLMEAGKLLDAFILAEPTTCTAYYARAQIKLIFNDEELAIQNFRQCALNAGLEKDPEQRKSNILTGADAMYQLSVLYLKRNDVVESLNCADQAVKTVPNAPDYLAGRASALIQSKRLEDAEKDLASALKLDPKNVKAISLQKFLSAARRG